MVVRKDTSVSTFIFVLGCFSNEDLIDSTVSDMMKMKKYAGVFYKNLTDFKCHDKLN